MFTRKNPANDPLLRRAAAASAKAARAIQTFNNAAAQARARGLEEGRRINAAQGPRLSNAKVAELVEAERKGVNNLLKARAENRANFEKWRESNKGVGSAGQERRSQLLDYYYPIVLKRVRAELDPKHNSAYNIRGTLRNKIVKIALVEADKLAKNQEYKDAWDAHAPRRAFLAKQRNTRKKINNALKNPSKNNGSKINPISENNAKLNEELATMNLNSLPNAVL
jgi:hypothetical protein